MGEVLMLAMATILTVGSVALLSVSFSTEHWLDYVVNRDDATLKAYVTGKTEVPYYYTRYRGLLQTCFPGNDTAWLDSNPDKIDTSCLVERGYEIPTRRTSTIAYGDDYEIRIHLMRSHFALVVVALMLLLVTIILGFVGCWTRKSSVVKACGLLVFLAAFFTAGGIAMFHGYEYLEKQKIDQAEFPKQYLGIAAIKNATNIQYGYSYILGWMSMALSSLSAILYLCAAFSIVQLKQHERGVYSGRDIAPSSSSRKKRKAASRQYSNGQAHLPQEDFYNQAAVPYMATLPAPVAQNTYPAAQYVAAPTNAYPTVQSAHQMYCDTYGPSSGANLNAAYALDSLDYGGYRY